MHFYNILSCWNKFWFRESSTQTLCIFRIIFGSILICRLTGLYGLYKWPTWKIRIPNHTYPNIKRFLFDGYYCPVDYFNWLPIPSYEFYQFAEHVLLVLVIFFTVGFFTRLVGPIIALWMLYHILVSQFNAYHHVVFLTFTLTILGFSPCADHFSIDSFIAPRDRARPKRMILPTRLLQCYLSIVYFGSGTIKWSPEWFSGGIIEWLSNDGLIKGYFKETIFSIVSCQVIGVFTVFTETFLIFALWFKKTRKIGILFGVFLHLGIDMMMAVTTFSYQMISMYLVFLEPKTRMTKVTYNPDDKLLWKIMRLAQLLDWFLRIEWNYSSNNNGITVIEPDGRVRCGFDGVLEVLTRLPLTFVPATILQMILHIACLKFPKNKDQTEYK